jgi:hypothetical protein
MEKGVPSVGADGLPSCTSTGLFLEIDDRGNKRDDCLMNYYWRIAERRGWDGRPVPLGARQGLALLTSKLAFFVNFISFHLLFTTLSPSDIRHRQLLRQGGGSPGGVASFTRPRASYPVSLKYADPPAYPVYAGVRSARAFDYLRIYAVPSLAISKIYGRVGNKLIN